MKYEDFVRRVCGDNWKTVDPNEREGGFGVGCVLAFMRGAKSTIPDLANHLGVAPDDIVVAYNRLSRHGVFSYRFNAKKDRSLLSQCGEDDAQRAWAHIAGISSGFIGI